MPDKEGFHPVGSLLIRMLVRYDLGTQTLQVLLPFPRELGFCLPPNSEGTLLETAPSCSSHRGSNPEITANCRSCPAESAWRPHGATKLEELHCVYLRTHPLWADMDDT